MSDERIDQMITYTPEMAAQIEQLKERLIQMPFPIFTRNVSEIVSSAVLRLSRDIAAGQDITGAQIRAWNAQYPDNRGVGGGAKKTTRHIYLPREADEGIKLIGAYLEKRFAKSTVPKLYTNRGKLNGQLICAYAVYYCLEVDG